jgi:hypothetical protein
VVAAVELPVTDVAHRRAQCCIDLRAGTNVCAQTMRAVGLRLACFATSQFYSFVLKLLAALFSGSPVNLSNPGVLLD